MVDENKNKNKNLIAIAIAIVIVGILIAGMLFYINQGKEKKIAGSLTAQQAAEKTINFINQYLVEPPIVASLINVAEERGLYKISFKAGEDEYNSYVTKDGKLLFFQAIDMEREVSETQPTKSETQPTEEEKTEKEKKFSDEQLETLAKCLSEKEVKFYGSSWCGWCKKQKEVFGQAAQYLPYIECIDEKTKQMTSQCKEAEIQGFPTWEFFGEKIQGFKTPEELSQLANCPF
ncbi:MAG: thioredoxin domain-containing protein [Patescibacteria group bacterium]|nr:thioredoxin domain-containing protein [Patescibacteria group bacterium]